jgi:hypothetical protein
MAKKPFFSVFRENGQKPQKRPFFILTTEKCAPSADSIQPKTPFLTFNQPLIRRGGPKRYPFLTLLLMADFVKFGGWLNAFHGNANPFLTRNIFVE